MKQPKHKIIRVSNRAEYDRDKINQILDSQILCHVGFVADNSPIVIPMVYGRMDDEIFIHGSSMSRIIKNIELGFEVCVSVANVQGLVLARSIFHHSANYQSVVIFGKGRLIDDEQQKLSALKAISEHIIVGRWQEVRAPNPIEMKATSVIAIKINAVSAKIRTGAPVDDKEDYDLDVWAGELPYKSGFAEPIADAKLTENTPLSASVIAKTNTK